MTELINQLKRHEGLKLQPYRCTAGKLTIGYGRNLDDMGITEEEADYLLMNDITRCTYEASQNIKFWDELKLNTQHVLINMCINMGIVKLIRFKKMVAALEQFDYKTAGAEIRDSLYWRNEKTHNRAEELAQIMEGSEESNIESGHKNTLDFKRG